MDVFDRISKLLDEKKIKKVDLAKGVDIPYSTLISMLKRHPENINYGIISRIAEYFEVETDYLFYGDADFSKNLDEMYSQHFVAENDKLEPLIEKYEEKYNFEQRMIDSMKINIEYIYQNNTSSNLSLNFYKLDYFAPFWQIIGLLVSLSLKDNYELVNEINKENETYKTAIEKLQPPFNSEKMEDISHFRKLMKDNDKKIIELQNKISILEKRLISIRENKHSPM